MPRSDPEPCRHVTPTHGARVRVTVLRAAASGLWPGPGRARRYVPLPSRNLVANLARERANAYPRRTAHGAGARLAPCGMLLNTAEFAIRRWLVAGRGRSPVVAGRYRGAGAGRGIAPPPPRPLTTRNTRK